MVASYPLLSQAPTPVEVELGCDNNSIWDELSTPEKEKLMKDLSDIDLAEMTDIYQKTFGDNAGPARDMTTMEPVNYSLCESIMSTKLTQLDMYRSLICVWCTDKRHCGQQLLDRLVFCF